jgi:hypothetical protein
MTDRQRILHGAAEAGGVRHVRRHHRAVVDHVGIGDVLPRCVHVHPVAAADASRHATTRPFSGWSDAIVGERTIQVIEVSAGTMLALSPAR